MCASRCAWMNSERGPGAEVRSNALTRAQCRETTQGKAHGTQAILGMAMMGTLEGRAGVSQHAISVIIPAQQRLIAQDPSRRPTAQPPNRPTAQPPNRPTAQPLSRSVAQSLSRSVAQSLNSTAVGQRPPHKSEPKVLCALQLPLGKASAGP